MIGVVYLGNSKETEERLKYIPGRLVQFAKNYKEAASVWPRAWRHDFPGAAREAP